MTQIPYISAADLDALGLTSDDIITSIETALQGVTHSAPKAVILPGDGRYMMAALACDEDVLTVKTVVVNPDNPANGLPQINGLVTMLDASTGLPVAILDGNWITAVRTAGLSATAARHLANPTSETIGVIGTGVQARSHLDAFSDMFPLKHAKIFGRGQANIDTLTAACAAKNITTEIAPKGQDAIEDVDLIVTSITATTAPAPFLDASKMKKGAFAAVTDLGTPWIHDHLSALDQLTIDDLAQEAALPNKLCHPQDVTGDLAQLVSGAIPKRTDPQQRTAFVFRGHALGDLAVSALAWKRFNP